MINEGKWEIRLDHMSKPVICMKGNFYNTNSIISMTITFYVSIALLILINETLRLQYANKCATMLELYRKFKQKRVCNTWKIL
ncbi:hypothetical protein D920_01914 [Enterococcus faecalis 13-SD-W-01]|nr:hypothetical protein D920_01914 [Enterococcus faecalis 13-SD-W-01]